MIIFHNLSKRQLTEINSGGPVRVAIPILASDELDNKSDDEVEKWIVDTLPNMPPDKLTAWETGKVWCHLLNRSGTPRSLNDRLGPIVDNDKILAMPCYQVDVVIVSINAGPNVTRWPGGESVWTDGGEPASTADKIRARAKR